MEEDERCRGAGLEEEEGQVVGRVNQDKVPTYLRWTVKKVQRSTSRLTMLLDQFRGDVKARKKEELGVCG
ncbi:hypothetical protein HYQ46_001375 [Verticillium longisporum]|nr:hypothetical protein HYQ46_001375 [Verticillium longisporum]